MKQTAYGKPILIKDDKISALNKIDTMDEASIQELVFKYPSCLPISDIDESFNPVIPVCKELNTSAGPLDIFMITPTGGIVIIETKLWRNPEARRKIVAQILDYAKELSRWSYEDLQREINRRLNQKGNTLYRIAKESKPNQMLKEDDFVDAVSRNLSRGKFLLLIVGDGIREGAAGIAEFLTSAGHLNFTFGMVELVLYENAAIGSLIIPRVISKTVELQKIIVDIPEGLKITSSYEDKDPSTSPSAEWKREKKFYSEFWKEFIDELSFDDPGQPLPELSSNQNLYVYPGKTRKAWISAYFMKSNKRIGVYFRCQNDSDGDRIYSILSEEKERIKEELGNDIIWNWDEGDAVGVRLSCKNIFAPDNRPVIKEYFQKWLNTFVNVFRPRMKKYDL